MDTNLCNQSNSETNYMDKVAMIAEWFDPSRKQVKNYMLLYFPFNDMIELHDMEAKKLFLRRQKVDGVSWPEMYLGSVIRVYSRQMTLVEYANEYTKKRLSAEKQYTLVIVKPDTLNIIGHLLNIFLKEHRFILGNMRMVQMAKMTCLEFYKVHIGTDMMHKIIDFLSSGSVLVLLLVGSNAIERCCNIMGPEDPEEGKKTSPESLRAIHGIDSVRNALHCSATLEDYLREREFFFPTDITKPLPPSTGVFTNSTLCIIKPHVIKDGTLGDLIQEIVDSKFRITALQMQHLSIQNAEEYLTVYKGAVADYSAMLNSFMEGPCIALEISAEENFNVPKEFKTFVGPTDPTVARQTRANSLRAIFGRTVSRNAVHCTTIEEEAEAEVEYFFRILVNQ